MLVASILKCEFHDRISLPRRLTAPMQNLLLVWRILQPFTPYAGDSYDIGTIAIAESRTRQSPSHWDASWAGTYAIQCLQP